MEPTAGDAWVAGFHIVREAERIKENIGYMSQRFGLYADLTVMENIRFYADIYNEPRRGFAEKIDRLLGFSNLTPFQHRLAGNLSGGMKQKLGLACSLVHTPKVLLLDEPTNGVDPVSRRDFWRILHQLQQENVTIFVSTSYLDEADRCHRVGLMHCGRLLACGTPAEVKRLMRGTIVEIRTAEPRRAGGIASAAIDGRFRRSVRRPAACRLHDSERTDCRSDRRAVRKLGLNCWAPASSSRRWKMCLSRCWPRRTRT